MSEAKPFDVVVLGGGPGGYTAAFRAADLGLSVCLVDKQERLGGVCLNVGCIPSKTLLHAAAVIEEAAEIAEFGVDFAPPKIDITRVLAKKNAVIEQLTSGLDGLCKARKITRLTGKGVFKSATTLAVTGPDGEQEVQFVSAIIATGSYPFVLPNIPKIPVSGIRLQPWLFRRCRSVSLSSAVELSAWKWPRSTVPLARR